MRHSLRTLVVFAFVAALTAFTTNATAAVCTGVPAFATCTAYANGAKVVYNNTLYHSIASIPSNRDCPPNSPFNPSNDNWWVNDGVCGGSATATATTSARATATPTTPPSGGAIGNGLYVVKNQNSAKCVDAAGSGTANNTVVQQYTCNSTAAQQWQLTGTDSGYFRVGSRNNTNQGWDVSGVSTADGAKVILWAYGGGANQQWQPVSLGGGFYKLVVRHDGKCLDVNGASTANSVQLQQWACNGSAAQSFSITSTSAAPTATTPPSATPTTPPSSGGTARFAPYADISLGIGSQVASNAASAGIPGITLAFLVDGGCSANWGGGLGNVSNAMFPNGTSVKSAIDSMVGAGRKVLISWGGANGSIASSCSGAANIQAMYQQVFNAYPNITGQDFDIEGGIDATAVCNALKGLKAANSSKSISLTLPVLSSGLVSAGLNIVNTCHSVGFHPDTINVMAMDMGSANDNGGNMLLSSQQAAQNTRSQTGDNIGVTPMIGVNDTSTEIFTLSNASGLVSWAKGQSYINRLAFWSMARDNGGCAGQTYASATCSGVSQSTWQFSSIFNGF